jgi:hypothetical protein
VLYVSICLNFGQKALNEKVLGSSDNDMMMTNWFFVDAKCIILNIIVVVDDHRQFF